MTDATIELLKNWEPAKMTWPASATVKYDGVPLFYQKTENGLVGYTRQGTVNTSLIGHAIYQEVWELLEPGEWIAGEVWHRTHPFKAISGAVRQQDRTSMDLQLWIFDADCSGGIHRTWLSRMLGLEERMATRGLGSKVRSVKRVHVNSGEECEQYLDSIREVWPTVEGLVIHSHGKEWSPGKRCWGTQRLKPSPTIDVKVVAFEEATSAGGEGLGMVGRISVEFTGIRPDTHQASTIIGVGPGSLTHAERRAIFAAQHQYIGRVAEVKYMRDDSYSALRQPTFVRWRDDKDV